MTNRHASPDQRISGYVCYAEPSIRKSRFKQIISNLSGVLLDHLRDGMPITLECFPRAPITKQSAKVVIHKKLRLKISYAEPKGS